MIPVKNLLAALREMRGLIISEGVDYTGLNVKAFSRKQKEISK